MKSKLLIYSILGTLLSIALQSCDPHDLMVPSYRYSLIISNDLNYPVLIRMNFNAQDGGDITAGDNTLILHPGTECYLISDNYLNKTSTPFEDIWIRFNKKTIKCQFYRLNTESNAKEELLADWGFDSPFFKEGSWKLESHPGYYYEDKDPLTVCNWSFTLSQILM
jgi:hypothetical protein